MCVLTLTTCAVKLEGVTVSEARLVQVGLCRVKMSSLASLTYVGFLWQA